LTSDIRAEAVVERAVAWALGQVGSDAWALRCLAFVEDAYEIPNRIEVFGGDFASASAALYEAHLAKGDPPRGAFVFFSTSGPVDGVVRDWGHVGLALSDGRMVHAWPHVRVDAIGEARSLPSGGWTPPRAVGWASPSRILEGAVDRRAERQA
jgi:hypothetical protein